MGKLVWVFLTGISILSNLIYPSNLEANEKSQDPFIFSLLEDKDKVNEIVGLIREAITKKDLKFSAGVISSVSTPQKMLRYGNSEIKEAIADLYLFEASRVNEVPSPNNPWEGSGEFGTDYLMELASLAECTLSPRIFQVEMFGVYQIQYQTVSFLGGKFRYEYLARVNPEKTLDILLSATVGIRHPDYLYLKSGDKILSIQFSIEDAFFVISKMRATSPELVRRRKEEILQFIRKYVFHYAGKYGKERFDYIIRSFALDLYEFWNDPSYIQDVVKISKNVPQVPHHKFLEHWGITEALEKKAEKNYKDVGRKWKKNKSCRNGEYRSLYYYDPLLSSFLAIFV